MSLRPPSIIENPYMEAAPKENTAKHAPPMIYKTPKMATVITLAHYIGFYP